MGGTEIEEIQLHWMKCEGEKWCPIDRLDVDKFTEHSTARPSAGFRAGGRDDEDRLVADMIELARQYGRYGYRRIAALLHDAGWQVNDKRVENACGGVRG